MKAGASPGSAGLLPGWVSGPDGMIIDVLCRPGCRRVPVRVVRETALQVLRSVRRRRAQVSILLTRDAEIRALNRRYRGMDSPTDVLSFPSQEEAPREGHLGDVVVSVESAARYARKAGWRLRHEIQFLVIHGILHLLGQDHESDGGEMERTQARIARRILGRDIPEIRLPAAARAAPGTRRSSRRVRISP